MRRGGSFVRRSPTSGRSVGIAWYSTTSDVATQAVVGRRRRAPGVRGPATAARSFLSLRTSASRLRAAHVGASGGAVAGVVMVIARQACAPSPEGEGGVVVELVDQDFDRLLGLEAEGEDPLAVAVADVEGPLPVAVVSELRDWQGCPLPGGAAPDGPALVDGDALCSDGDLEAHLV